jgi:hypothetical protein
MFSKDAKHYRQTPRTVQEAFGAYHRLDMEHFRKYERLTAIVGVLIVGAFFGYCFAS